MPFRPEQLLDWQLWVGPLVFIFGALLLGWVLERTLLAAARKVLEKTSLELNQNITSVLKGVVVGLFVLGGLYLATFSMPYVTEQSMEITRRILFILAMLLAVQMTARIAVVLVRFYFNRTPELQALPNTSIFENIIKIAVYLIGTLMLLQTLGVSVVPLLTALGVGGLAISLALQDTLANMFAGVNMILARHIKVGDYVKLETGDFEGFIEDIGWRSTVIRRLNNNRIVVPNSKMASTILTNFMLPISEMSLVLEVGVAYGSDLAKVEQVTVDVARSVLQEVEGGVKDFEPFIRLHTFADSSVNFSTILRVQDYAAQYAVKHEFYKRLHARYKEEGIEIPFPQRVLHLDREMLREAVAAGRNGHGETAEPARKAGGRKKAEPANE